MTTLTTTIDLGRLGECAIDVGYVHAAAHSGKGIEPDEPERCEIYAVLFNGANITDQIGDELMYELRGECLDDWRERIAMVGDYRYQQLRDCRLTEQA